MGRLLVLLSLVAAPGLAQDAELAAAVDQPTPELRRKAALALADDEVPLEAWLTVMKSFLPRGRAEPGVSTVTVPLLVEGRIEATEITSYVPPGYRATKPAPMLIVLHGAGGDGRHEPARWRDVADALGMVVVAPTEAVEEGGYAFTARERRSVLATVRWARRMFNVDENRIHLTGISRGGHLTWDVGLRFFDRFASLSPMIGGPRLTTQRGQNNLRFLENVCALPIRDLQGEGDDPRMLFNLRLAFQRLETLRAKDAKLITFPGMGHTFDMSAVDWGKFFTGARRDPAMARVVRLCADVREGRGHWVEVVAVDRLVKESFVPQVKTEVWNALDDAGKRVHLEREALRRTARLEVVRQAPGSFVAKGSLIRKFRLLLAPGMFDAEKPVSIEWNGRVRKVRVRPDKRTLLLDFVERFDRTLLPVARITVP